MCVMVVVNYPNLALDQYIGSSLLAMQIHPTGGMGYFIKVYI